MSPSKLNSLLIGIFYVVIVAVGSSVASADSLRLFAPYGPDSFGGGRRGNDGMYSSLSRIYWSIGTPRGGYIGATNIHGKNEGRWVFDGSTGNSGTISVGAGVSGQHHRQTNSIGIGTIDATNSLGTRLEVGNRRGHHGWLVGVYGLPGQSRSFSANGVSMAIRDDVNRQIWANTAMIPAAVGGTWTGVYFWDTRVNPSTSNPIHSMTPAELSAWANGTTSINAGYLWGVTQQVDGDERTAVFAPLPVVFESVVVSTRAEHQSAEFMYTYRTHPFVWGGMELLTGARYWDFDDRFRFSGLGHTAHVSGAIATNPTAFSALNVDARAQNRVFGPQFGVKLNRHNARWTFGAEGRLTAGINSQSVRSRGFREYNPDWTPIGAPSMATGVVVGQSNNVSFRHTQNKAYFSPIGEARLTAAWQWTNAVSFFGSLDGMFAGNVARGVRVTDYAVTDTRFFGIRGDDRNTTVLVYGVGAGVMVNR